MRADVTAGRFLSDLRALRTEAGLDHGQLAARAHYPRDVIAAAEAGPYLPALPVLAAYVRGCGGTGDQILAWEDRWRLVTGAKAHPLLSARVAGLSGANRPLSPENSDPEAIRTALHRLGDQMSQPGPASDAVSPGAVSPGAVSPAPEPEAPESAAAEPGAPGFPREEPRKTVPNPVTPVASSVFEASVFEASPEIPPETPLETPPETSAPPVADAPAAPDRSGLSGPTIAIVAIIAALVILLVVILVL